MAGDLEDITENTDNYDLDEEQEAGNLEAEDESTFGDDDASEEGETAEDEELDGEPSEEEEPEEPLIDLGDEQVPLSELKEGRLRQQDYSRKMAEVTDLRKEAETTRDQYAQNSTYVNSLLQNMTNWLEGVIPPEPDFQLSRTDPGEYQYQKALREKAMSEVAQVVQLSKQAQHNSQQVTQQQQAEIEQKHLAGLEKSFPHIKGSPEKLNSFVESARKSAIEFGFTEQEVANVTDNRILEAMHFAALGRRSVENRNNAKRRIQTPKKGTGRPATATGNSNRKAMQRLEQTGSLRDALKIDIE